MPPPDVVDKVMSGEGFIIQFEDGLAAHKHRVQILKEEVASGPAGYYFRLHLPIGKEIRNAILHFSDNGIIQKVSSYSESCLLPTWVLLDSLLKICMLLYPLAYLNVLYFLLN